MPWNETTAGSSRFSTRRWRTATGFSSLPQALAQVIRNPARQVRLWRMIQNDRTEVVPLDGLHAQAVGVLLAQTGTADIADAHVVICAQRAGHAVITSDPFDLRRLDPRLRMIAV